MKEDITITEVTEEEIHSRNTRAMPVKRAIYNEQVSSKKLKTMEALRDQGQVGPDQQNYARREAELVATLSKLGDNAQVYLQDEAQYLRGLSKKDILVLSNPLKEVNDNIIFIALRYMFMEM